jgi:hypothetical protein
VSGDPSSSRPSSSRTPVGVKYPRYCGSPVTTQNSGYDRFPLVSNGWGTIHPIQDKAQLLHAEEGGPPT